MSQSPASRPGSHNEAGGTGGTDEQMTDSMREVMSLRGDRRKLQEYYDAWADDYDADVADHGYGLPQSMVETLTAALAVVDHPGDRFGPHCEVLDAGCGTGLVGAALAAVGYRNIDGVDLSSEMVALAAERGLYRRLEAGVDLTVPPAVHLRHSADIVTVGGVFTVGHVPPSALVTVAGLVKPGGVLVVSTRPAYQAESGYDGVSASLVADGTLSLLVHHAGRPYTMDSHGDYWAYRIPDIV